MKYIEEKHLRDNFWSKYGYRKNIINYQFECKARTGGVDLLTVESLKDKNNNTQIQFIGFEFKLDDIKKAIAQAEFNLVFCHKVFIVIPIEKKKVIEDKYLSYLKEKKYIGVIGIEFEGKWEMIYQPRMQPDEMVMLNNEILKLCCKII